MRNEDIVETLRKKFERLSEVLDERGRRVWAAAEAEAWAMEGKSIVAKATGLSRTTLHRGLENRARRLITARRGANSAGGGWAQETDDPTGPELLSALESAGGTDDPRRSRKPVALDVLSTRQLAAALTAQGYPIGRQTVAHLLANWATVSRAIARRPKEGQPSGSGRAIPLYSWPSSSVPRSGTTGRVGRHQEKGIGG